MGELREEVAFRIALHQIAPALANYAIQLARSRVIFTETTDYTLPSFGIAE